MKTLSNVRILYIGAEYNTTVLFYSFIIVLGWIKIIGFTISSFDWSENSLVLCVCKVSHLPFSADISKLIYI